MRRRVDFYSKEREEPTLPLLACFLNANHIASVKVKRTLGMDPCSAGRKPACVTSFNSISEFQLHAGGVDENPQTPDFVQFAGSKSRACCLSLLSVKSTSPDQVNEMDPRLARPRTAGL